MSVLILAVGCGIAVGEYEDDDEGRALWQGQPEIAPVTNQQYSTECGSCHFAYQPGLLPEQSWKKIMSGLADHFGDNAELSPAVNQSILNYLVNNSADKVDYRRSRRIMRSIPQGTVPARITEIPYIRREHSEIPARMISGNAKVTSLSHCDACHQKVQAGFFNERHIRIPGYGKWDD